MSLEDVVEDSDVDFRGHYMYKYVKGGSLSKVRCEECGRFLGNGNISSLCLLREKPSGLSLKRVAFQSETIILMFPPSPVTSRVKETYTLTPTRLR